MNVIDKNRAITAEDLIRRYNLEGLKTDRKNITNINNTLTRQDNIIKNYVTNITPYKSQAKNYLTAWFFNGLPTLETEPFINFTEEEKESRLNDVYYNQDTGFIYQLIKNEDYEWLFLNDEKLRTSLAYANSEADTSDYKRNIYYEIPTTPYEVGDIWINDNSLMRCRCARNEGEYNPVDWCIQSEYSDEFVLLETRAILNQFKTTVEENYTTNVQLEATKDSILGVVESETTRVETIINNNYQELNSNVTSVTNKVETLQTSTDLNITAIEELKENDETQSKKIAEFEITVDGVSTTIENQNNQISQVTQTVEELNSKISDIADITISKEDIDAQLEFEDINQSEPIRIVIRPIGESISYLYPHDNLYPSDTLYLKNRKIRFTNTKTEEIFDYELPTDLLYYDSENYDEFILDYDGQSCVVNKRVGYNADGTTYVLDKPTTLEFAYPTGNKAINLTDGDYVVNVLGYNNAYIFVRLMAQNIYTTQFATRAELNSEISQTASEINLEVSKKVGNDEVISKINQSAESVNIEANKININGVITAINNDTSTTINGDKITTGSITSKEIAANAITADKVSSDIITTTNFSAQEIDADNITTGTLSADRVRGGTLMGANFKGDTDNSSYFTIGTNDLSDAPSNGFINLIDSSNILRLSLGTRFKDTNLEQLSIYSPNARFFNFLTEKADSRVGANAFVADSFMYSPAYNGGSLESIKKNIELYDKDCLDIIKKADIYSYNLKNENNNCKKHIGLIIGDLGGNYNTPTEIINNENNGIDLYSMISVAWKAIREQEEKYQKEINQLKEEIKQLKESDK